MNIVMDDFTMSRGYEWAESDDTSMPTSRECDVVCLIEIKRQKRWLISERQEKDEPKQIGYTSVILIKAIPSISFSLMIVSLLFLFNSISSNNSYSIITYSFAIFVFFILFLTGKRVTKYLGKMGAM